MDLLTEKQRLSDTDLNRFIQNVFLLTLNDEDLGPQGPPTAVYLSSYREHMAKPLFDMENVVNPFFERMLMPAGTLSASLIMNPISKSLRHGSADQSDVVAYLGECFMRLHFEKHAEDFDGKDIVCDRLEALIMQNLRLGFQEPDLLSGHHLPRQFFEFYRRTWSEFSNQITSFTQKFLCEGGPDFDNVSAGFSVLTFLDEKAKNLSLMRMGEDYEFIIHTLSTFSSHPELARILLRYSTPKNSRDAVGAEGTLLGSVLRVSCLPPHNDMPCEFFGNPVTLGQREILKTEEFIWSNTVLLADAVFRICNNIVRQSADLREAFLHWVGDCLSANFGRAKMWQPSMQFQIRLASDGFVMNLSALLLRLCRPFVNPPKNQKISKIHHLFPASVAYLRKLPEETTILPKPENPGPLEVPKDFNFITTCFFLCHESLRLGWRQLWDRFVKYGRILNELEGQLEEVRESGNTDEQRIVEQRVNIIASRHLSIRAALTVPLHMELMVEFSVCTATWLAQMAVQPASISLDQLPTQFLPLFPLPSEVPIHLQTVPEFLVENVAEVLTCYSRMPVTSGNSFDWKYEWMEELMNMALVYMSGHDRMKNPHLRAKMAMLMHNLMPHKRFADTYQERHVSKDVELLDALKERLFKEHENKQEYFPAVLDVFVSIEMSGNNLRFGEAFHYRRPLYALMEYLFTLEYHQQRLEDIAAQAVGSLEATNPPVFLRFLNILINDSTLMLDEALNDMSKLKTLEAERPSWASLTEEQRKEKESDFQHQGEIARSYNVLARETIQCLKNLTAFKNPDRILLNSVMVDRLAAMLNYFLRCLVGTDKRSQYKVKDFQTYSFNPKDLVDKISTIYVNLGKHDARKDFLLAICRDKRSYNPKLFQDACYVLNVIGGLDHVIESISILAKDVEKAEQAENEEEELLMDEDVPDEYLDPIMSHLMRDPVLLPTSGKIVDRSTIARILLSDQSDPFNRQFLTMDLVRPAEELRNEIEAWIQRRRDTKDRLIK